MAYRTAALSGRLLIAPSMDYLERAFNHSKYGEVSARPSLEITIPTVNDPALASAGGHVLSAIVQYAPYTPRVGWERSSPAVHRVRPVGHRGACARPAVAHPRASNC